ncbi:MULTISPECIES: 1,2-phenylacetyl-CoA epoxidase subunit PaaD [Acetobacter]|uniref:1,2-phenylacetyl-CoA epoxidase subunit PaaD n=1 Tax=Acetobacter TaxID=434 RepID=UPI00209FE826|nr:phenylacetate-CoA oxygenase subunit PaaJ [Acetobacter indonesiensis]MCP1271303.1 phenylacetate-CoA oxygenase subunit PaaJ [Acetobacter cerevisiae]MCP1279240.1 phenylacetate-CoA oxygenase subunit PaaJ [Acetobacter cerevisiae]
MTPQADALLLTRVLHALDDVTDPEIPVLTIADLGILRDVRVHNGVVDVTITPTYSGCPAMNMITLDIETALARAGIENFHVNTTLSPAWTTAWLSEAGRQKLLAYGIAPPQEGSGRGSLFGTVEVACPQCGSTDTSRLAEFGSTSCKALWRCNTCREPFDYFRCH